MNQIDEQMLMIKSIDPGAHLDFSDYTRKWYVVSRIEERNDDFLISMGVHAETPAHAVNQFLAILQNIDKTHCLAYGSGDKRRMYRWNGAAFAEVPC